MGPAQVHRSLEQLPSRLRQGALTIGNFDGVHRGHAAIARRVADTAARLPGPAIAFTFDPHPARLLRPELAPTPLGWTRRKAALLGQLGIEVLIAYPTDRAILQLSPAQFFQQVVMDCLAARAMVEGPNFQFGRNRSGSIDVLADFCRRAGVELQIVPPLLVGDEYVSSSRIRRLIQAGDVRQARQLLGRPHRVRGRVVAGVERGRVLGFPTANLQPVSMLLPPHGVYAGMARTVAGWYPAAIHLGPNPTFAEQQTKFEIHLIGFQGDLYGQDLEVDFIDRIRDVRPFAGVDALTSQLQADLRVVLSLVPDQPAESEPEY